MKMIAVMSVLMMLTGPAAAEFGQCHKWPPPSGDQINQAQLWNPADSGKVVHLSRIHLHSDADTSWNVIATNEPFPELRNPGHALHLALDGRNAGVGELRGLLNRKRGEFQIYSLYVWSARAFDQLSQAVEITIPPGWGIAVASRDSGASLAACFDWRETDLEPS